MLSHPSAYTVSSITEYIRHLFEADLRMQDAWVQGEISNFTRHSSGHWYFTLKDEKAALRCVMWKGKASLLRYIPREGDVILVHGEISVYEVSGQYQLYVDKLQPAGGQGELYVRFEQLKAILGAEGLFDAERKRPLPAFPRRIGVVTSPTAAAFQDVLNVLRRRFPLAEVILSPTLVQGDDAPPQIVAALDRINAEGVDVILLVRGGGSIEDLWAFNDEAVARAVARSRAPVVSGIGHEVDFTIADYVADRRAPTPSAAAEIATPDIADLQAAVGGLQERLLAGVQEQFAERRRQADYEARLLRGLSPARRLDTTRQSLDELVIRLDRALSQIVDRGRERLTAQRRALAAADPRAIMARGYAIVERKADGARLREAASAAPGEALSVHFSRGRLHVIVDEIYEE